MDIPNRLTNGWILFFLLLLAAIFRFWNFFNLPFSHDEFSALFRTRFDNFSDLIEIGVLPDGHPALIQVLSYYYVGWFGEAPWVGKFPYILAGIGALYFAYQIAKNWFNETVAVIVVSYMVAMQYLVMYSTIARPYISGLFFAMVMVHFWTKLVQSPNQHYLRNAAFYILASALCAYNHYFSLLFTAIVGVTGFFVSRPQFRLRFVILGLTIFALYIPHLSIFFYHLNVGGVEEWLGKPQINFLPNYIFYALHFSWIVVAVTTAIILQSLVFRETWAKNRKYILISFLWFFIPFGIGYYYSIQFNGVLQNSVMIFSFPFLLLFLFGWIKPMPVKWNAVLALVIVGVMGSTLVVSRQHFAIASKGYHKMLLMDYFPLDSDKTAILLYSHDNITEDYLKKWGKEGRHVSLRDFESLSEFQKAVSNYQRDGKSQVYLGVKSRSNPSFTNVISEYYPGLVWQNNYFGGTSALYSLDTVNVKSLQIKVASLQDIKHDPRWSGLGQTFLAAPSYSDSIVMSANSEWGPGFKILIDSLSLKSNDFIDVQVTGWSSAPLKEVLLVNSIQGETETKYWSAQEFQDFQWREDGCFTVCLTLKVSDIMIQESDYFVTNIWNKGLANFSIYDFRIYTRVGNPIIYGVNERLYD